MGSGRAVPEMLDDLQRIFGDRLDAVVTYGRRADAPIPSLALVRSLSIEDLYACAARTAAWRRAGAAAPLLLTSTDFARSLDAFPIEYGEILERHELVFGSDPFDGLTIHLDDLRRACEVQVKSHLLHLREDFLEGGARPAAIDALVRDSAPGFAALLRQLARLDGTPAGAPSTLVDWAVRRAGLDRVVVDDMLALENPTGLPSIDALKLFPAYLTAMGQLAGFVDRWRKP